MVVGSILGGPWVFIIPAAGLGFAADMRLGRGGHGCFDGERAPDKNRRLKAGRQA